MARSPARSPYPLVFFDAIRVKIGDEGTVRNKPCTFALGVRPDGTKEILGLWIEQNEDAEFWLRVMTELRNRSVEDVLIAIVDGLKGSLKPLPWCSRRLRCRLALYT
jgi:putative transposase